MEKNVYNPYKIFCHLNKIGRLKRNGFPAPIFVQWDLTNKCNLDCNFCFYHLYKLSDWKVEDTIDLDVARKTLDDLKEMGVKAIEFTGGGEPLIHPYFKEIVTKAKELGFECSLVTNGVLLNDEIIELIKDFKWVRISVDAASRDIYNKVKRRDLFVEVIDKLCRLIDRKDENTVVGISFIVCPDNYISIYSAAVMAKDLGCENIRFSMAMTPEGNKMFDGIWEICVEQINKAKELENDDFNVFSFSNRINDLENKTKSGPCYYADLVGVIAANGAIYPCCRLKDDTPFNLGNINDTPFNKIWYGGKRKKLIRTVRKDCPYSCWMRDKNKVLDALVNPDNIGHKNFI